LARAGALPQAQVASSVAALDLEPDAPFALDR
jgi:hypothetical protein